MHLIVHEGEMNIVLLILLFVLLVRLVVCAFPVVVHFAFCFVSVARFCFLC